MGFIPNPDFIPEMEASTPEHLVGAAQSAANEANELRHRIMPEKRGTKAGHYGVAQRMGISGRSKMNKSDLDAAIREAGGDPNAPVVVQVDEDEVFIVNTDYGSHLDEFGSKNNPAYSPLRNGVLNAGFDLEET